MTRDDIIRMAREAGFQLSKHGIFDAEPEELERFAALVAAAEREDTMRCLEFHGCDDAIGYLNWRWKNRAKGESK